MPVIEVLAWLFGAAAIAALVAVLVLLFVVPLLYEILKERMFP